MNEIPTSLRMRYFRVTGKHLPTGEEGVIEFKRFYEEYSVLKRIVIVEKTRKIFSPIITYINGQPTEFNKKS